MIISERVFKIMKERGMSQKELADKTGITPSTISDWKRKKTNPASDKIMNICEALQITPYDILTEMDGENGMEREYIRVAKNSEEYELLEEYKELDEKMKQRVLGYVEALKK